MKAAFIVKLDVESISTLAETAEDIADDLSASGYLVISVVPWRRQGLVLTAEQQQLAAPPPLTPPPIV
jgi:hypothetical protein